MSEGQGGYSFPGLSAAWMLQSSVQGRIHSVSREAVPASPGLQTLKTGQKDGIRKTIAANGRKGRFGPVYYGRCATQHEGERESTAGHQECPDAGADEGICLRRHERQTARRIRRNPRM